MKLPVMTELKREDMQDAPEWIDPIINTVNTFMRTLYQAMDVNLVIDENVRGNIKSLYLDNNDFPYDLSNPLPVAPKIIIVGKIERSAGYHIDITTAPYVDWELTSDNRIIIHNILGIDSNKYNVNLLIL